MPDSKHQPSRREADKKLVEIHAGMTLLLGIFDIHLDAPPEHVHAMVTEANKDARFLRSFRKNTNQSVSHARNLTIYGLFTGLGILLLKIFHFSK